jgi:hypothetical protein
MFILKIYDRKGIELNLGDIVKVSDREGFHFFSEVKYLEAEKSLAPFHTFSFHSFEKVDKVPEGARKSTEERYNVWYLPTAIPDEEPEIGEKYLADWRQCEHLLEQKCYRIEKIDSKPVQQTLF